MLPLPGHRTEDELGAPEPMDEVVLTTPLQMSKGEKVFRLAELLGKRLDIGGEAVFGKWWGSFVFEDDQPGAAIGVGGDLRRRRGPQQRDGGQLVKIEAMFGAVTAAMIDVVGMSGAGLVGVEADPLIVGPGLVG